MMLMQTLASLFLQPGPGVAAARLNDKGSSQYWCSGLSDIDAEKDIDEHTLFDLASVSKTFTAAAVMLLVEESRLALDQPVAALLPFLNVSQNGRELLLRDLLWHTSGLQDYLAAGGLTETPLDDAHVQACLPDWSRQAIAGQCFEYSNTNYYVLAQLVAAVSGMPFETFMRQQVFEPLGMQDCGFITEAHVRERLARGYINYGYGVADWHLAEKAAWTLGDGGMCVSLADLMMWQRAFWSGSVVSSASLQWMQTPGQLDSGEHTDYGGGLQVETVRDQLWLGHAGSWVGTTTILGYYPTAGVSVVVLSNEQAAPVERISQLLAAGISV